MMRRVLLGTLLTVGLLAGAAPALAGDGHLCLAATGDKNNPGPSVLCIWTPSGQR